MRLSKLVALVCGTAVAATVALAPADAAAQAGSAAAMREAANTFLAALTPVQRAEAVMYFDHGERFNWNESPGPRLGVVLRDLNDSQKQLGMDLLSASVGEDGYQKVLASIARELVLAATQRTPEGAAVRQPDLFYIAVFDTPSATDPWGWRFEGHHISANFTIHGDTISNTPFFIGAQPSDLSADMTDAARLAADQIPAALAVRMLPGEEDKARELVESLDAAQREIGVFSQSEPYGNGLSGGRVADMLTGINNMQTMPLDPPGLPAAQMTADQKTILVDLVEVYLTRMPDDVAADRRSRLLEGSAVDAIAFRWHGSIESGEPHNYTIQGPTFIIEYAQSRGDSIGHIHTTWREFEGDFGLNLGTQ
jgi:hypothetical protein